VNSHFQQFDRFGFQSEPIEIHRGKSTRSEFPSNPTNRQNRVFSLLQRHICFC
jgi:hypothetical protein